MNMEKRKKNAKNRVIEMSHVFNRASKIAEKKLINNEEFNLSIELCFHRVDDNTNMFQITVSGE